LSNNNNPAQTGNTSAILGFVGFVVFFGIVGFVGIVNVIGGGIAVSKHRWHDRAFKTNI
jgi:hypothetical protein